MARRLDENSIFRANPDYRLTLIDRLSELDRNQLREAEFTEDLYGVLVPQGTSARGWHAVSCETALLFTALIEAGPLPRYALRRLGRDLDHTIRRLLLDGILQILLDGQFACGPGVAELFGPRYSSAGRDRHFDLAVSALRYGQELRGLSEPELGYRLYCYGRKPVSPQLCARLADTAALARFLGIDDEGTLVRSLRHRWIRVPVPNGAREYWWQWLSTSEPPRETARRASYKLYVSPLVDDAREALEALIGTLHGSRGVTGFKVGVGLSGITRPDKILVYFAELDDLIGFADRLRRRLPGCAAHGVPFTAAVSDDGLLSWGADPPRVSSGGERTTSWRMWVSRRLAEYLFSAEAAGLKTLEPWQYALERLALAGIDTDTWIPANGMWPSALESA